MRLLRLVDRIVDLTLYALAGFAAACLNADEPPTLRDTCPELFDLDDVKVRAEWTAALLEIRGLAEVERG